MKDTRPGLGSAKTGTEHWWRQRVTAIALVLLSFYVVSSFLNQVVLGGYSEATDWLSSPFSATFLILFLIAAFYHAALGLQVVIEDYIHSEGWKLFSLLAVKFTAAGFLALGILSVVKILFWSLLPNGQPPA